MAEFLTHEEASNMFTSKTKGNSALTLGIIGTALGALGTMGNNWNNGCGCNNGGGILGGLLGRNNCNNNCCCDSKLMAMAQGQIASDLAWRNRVQSMQDDAEIYRNIDGRLNTLSTTDWENRVKSMEDDSAVYTAAMNRSNDIERRLDNETQILTNQMYQGRIEDLKEKFDIYARGVDRDNAINSRICAAENAEKDDKFFLYTQTVQGDASVDAKFTKMNYEGRIQDLNEKFDLYTRLNNKITDLEKAQAKTETALPLMFELSKVNSERYTDACCCTSQKNLLMATNDLQRQLDHKIDGELKYSYNNLCAPVPSISPLYCTPFTSNGSGTTWTGCCQNSGCQSL